MAARPTPEFLNLAELVEKTISKGGSHRGKIKTNIKKALQELKFIKKGLKLQVSDPSYKLRYRHALDFWGEKTENEEIKTEFAEGLITQLTEELNSKEYIYSEAEESNEIILDNFFFPETPTKGKSAKEQSSVDEKLVWYVTSKCENKFYVKSSNNCETEREINTKDILCSYKLICPGDEVVPCFGDADKQSVNITKCNGLTSVETYEAKASFFRDLLTPFRCEDQSGLNFFNVLCTRYQGIWNHIKNDKVLFEDIQCVKDFMKLSLLMAEKLSKEPETCRLFLQDVSSSLFFSTALPWLIEKNSSELSSDDSSNKLKSLLALMVELCPQTASKILKVAKPLANVMHIVSSGGNGPKDNSQCEGVEYLVQLAEILAASVPGCQDVDTTNCEWNELPTIPTDKEILAAFDLKSLKAIKREYPYESRDEYLDINYRLLREECFRNLCTGIQNFRERKNNGTRNMNMYSISLKTIFGGDKQIFLVLKCEDYYKKENKDSLKEDQGTSDEILYGSLMCISLNKKFDSLIWATVVKSELQSNSTIKIRLCSDRNKMKSIDVLLKLSTITNKGDYALMAESPTFYQAFGPCMDRLKETHKKENMPLVKELVHAEKSDPPIYTRDKKKKCDWGIIFEKPSGCDFTFPPQLSPIEQYEYLQETVETSRRLLDETQMQAIENYLKNRVSLIQGPPGTGKTFLGEKILRLMLSMGLHKSGPILVMTYKNYALDNFLKPCLKHGKVIRIGRTEDPDLTKIILNNVLKDKGINRELQSMDENVTEKKRRSHLKLKSLFKYLSNPVVTLQSFLEEASESHIRSLLTDDPDQNIDDDDINQLLLERKETAVPKELKKHLKESLKRWLPKIKICDQERRPNYKKPESDHSITHSFSQLPTNTEEDVIDRNVLAKERQQDAVEDDFMDGDCEILDTPSKTEVLFDDETFTDDIDNPFLSTNYREDDDEELNLWELSEEKRVHFIRSLHRKIIRKFSEAVTSYEKNAKRHQEIMEERTVNILREYDIIGMTVTGAATRLHLLDRLKPCAVIVEEAAEIIEGQLISVLPPTIQHLVMLGDQEQLTPRVNCYELTKNKKHLDCSMFERLIRNKMNFTQLGQQCRMRNEIADLLRSLDIYKDLKTNEEKTKSNEPPGCIGHSLYFVNHTEPETQIKGSNSWWNREEIRQILKVAVYLMKDGYDADDVTVLCPYRGQVEKMKAEFQEKSSKSTEEYFTKLKNINITTVDSFQGRENKVILLSLVRSNSDYKIGFFGRKNRICVALSRAQCALYMFGNRAVYSASQDWKNIIKVLEKKGLVSRKFPFKEKSDQIITVKDEEPFCDRTKLSPPELTWLSLGIVGKWKEIAGLAELNEGEVQNVNLSNIPYPEAKDKARKILTMISNKPNFSRKELAEHLKETKLCNLVDGVLQGTCYDDDDLTYAAWYAGRNEGENAENSDFVQEITTPSSETKQKHEEIHKKNSRFKDTFLDSKRKLKEEIHEELKRFPWFCERGAYGITGPNKKIPRLHLFLTVKRGMKKSVVRRDLEDKFNCDAKGCFELLQEHKRKPKIKYLGDSNESSAESSVSSSVPSGTPSPGGGVLARINSGCSDSNPLRIPEENEREDALEMQGTGTLTMFCCFSKGQHYALTCFHVGCASDEMRLNAIFNNNEILNSLPQSVDEAKRKTYWFTDGRSDNTNKPIWYGDDGSNYTLLGDFHDSHFDSECDILAIKVREDTKIDCKIADVTSRDWDSIWDDLIELIESQNAVKVEKIGISSSLTDGRIVAYDVSVDNLFKNAIAVKGKSGPFFKSGDSGSPVFFHDKNDQKHVFAYCVYESDDLDLPEQPETKDFTTSSSDNDSDNVCEVDDLLSPEQPVSTSSTLREKASPEQATSSDDNGSDGSSSWSEECNSSDDSDRPEDTTGPFFICLRLDTALEKLGFDEAACVNDCGQN